jgi:hypothetical protein
MKSFSRFTRRVSMLAVLLLALTGADAFAQAPDDDGPRAFVAVASTPVRDVVPDRLDAPPAVQWADASWRSVYESDLDRSTRVARHAAESRAELARDFAPRPDALSAVPDPQPADDPRDSYSRLVKVFYHCSWPATLATGVADIATTHRNLEAGFVEANQFLVRKDGGFNYARKAALTVGSPVVNHHALWKRGHPWKAVGVNAFTATVNGVAAAHNERLFRTVTPDGRPIVRRAAKFTFRF